MRHPLLASSLLSHSPAHHSIERTLECYNALGACTYREEDEQGAGMQQGRAVSLAGPWRFRMDPDRLGDLTPADLVRTADDECAYYLPTYDDGDWQTIPVPGNWQQFGHDYNGVAWYRTHFARPEMPNDGIARLRF